MKNLRTCKLILTDICLVTIAMYSSYALRFDFKIPDQYKSFFFFLFPLSVFLQISLFYFTSLYARIWRFTSIFDLMSIIKAVFASSVFSYVCAEVVYGNTGYPRSILILYFLINILLTISARVLVRLYHSHFYSRSLINYDDFTSSDTLKKKILLIGAGKTGQKIANEILSTSSSKHAIVGFVDDDSSKVNGIIHGIKILCKVKQIPNLKVHYDEIIIAIPSADGNKMREIIKACKQTGKRYKTIPGLNELLNKDINYSTLRDVSYLDLLGREEVKLDMHSIDKFIKGKRVLVTGAGGSIGYELVKQCIKFKPSQIICIDNNEEKIFNINNRIENDKLSTVIVSILADVNSEKELETIFLNHQPQIVFHAAAYKHVPIQEIFPWAAVKTNIGGTLNLVRMSNRYQIEKFVLVSTDKAVNPVNIMGATKRLSEKIIQTYNLRSNTSFMAVRFGNVLGSSGSAIPVFQKQIKLGGPLTITHPEMTRYFMSIQEAAQLILQSGALGKNGEIFLLEMGKPIKILQMAKDLVRISGLEPEVDIPIVFTGLRPGEKLYEELQLRNEKKIVTNHKKIMILKEVGFINKNLEKFEQRINQLLIAAENCNSENIHIILKTLVPTFENKLLLTIDRKRKSADYLIKGEA